MSKSKSSLSQPIYEHLLHLIMTRQLAPGEHIPETAVAESFGVSRTPVRDAMRQLAGSGLIEIHPHRFAQVAELRPEAVRDIGMLRISLDSLAVKLAMLYGSHSDFMRLERIAARCAEGSQTNDDQLRRTADCDFHLELARISGNDLLLRFQQELYLRVNFILLYREDQVVNEQAHITQHFELVRALSDHDERAALRLISEHLCSFYNLTAQYPTAVFTSPMLSS